LKVVLPQLPELGEVVGRVKLDAVKGAGTLRLEHPPFDILLAHVDGAIYAIEDACNHAGASLAEGWLEGTCVVCPMHGYVFDLASGKLLRPRGLCGDQRRYRTTIEGDEVVVRDDFRLTVA
jgi:nitrite reductase/ring-hydroxylating ferredoxin subunit